VGRIDEMVRQLPPELQQEVEDFVRSLLEKRAKRSRSRPRFGWAGALKDLKEQYTSVQLQHRIAERRVDER